MSGYNYVEDVNSNLICCVCRSPFINPTITATCSHTFCKECITTSLELQSCCPIDRSPLSMDDLRPENLLLRNMVDELTVECSQRSSGCTHTCQRQHLEAHLEHSCLYVQVTCSEEGCDRTILRKDLGKHTHDCAHRVVTCEGCGVLVKASDLDVHNSECTAQDASCSYCEEAISRSRLKEHHEMCQEYPVPCQYAPYGCSWVGPRRNIKMEHLAGCAYAAINGFFSIYEEQTVRLRDENTLLRQQLERSEIAIQSLRREIKIAQHALGPWWRANAGNGESSGSSQERSGGSDSRRGIEGITVTTTTSSTSTPRSNVGNASTPTTAYTFDPSSRRGASLSAIMASFPDSPIMGTDSDDLEFEREHYSPMAVYNDSIHHGPHHLRDAMMTTNSMPHHNARAFPPILRFPDTVHTNRSLATHSNLHSSSTAVAPVDLSSTLEGALSSLRRSIVTLSASLDSLGRRQDIALTTENLRMNEEVGALRAVVHGLRMQVHSLITERNGTPWVPTSGHFLQQTVSSHPPMNLNPTASTTKL